MTKKLVQNLLHKELSYVLHGAAIEVRKDFGPGHKEQLYQKAFEEELKRRKIYYEREKAIKIFSPKDGKYIGLYRPDFVVDNKIIVEIKAERFVSRDEIKRIYDYLRNSKYELAYFINFASPKLYTKRIIFTNDQKPFYKKIGVLLVSISLILVSISGIMAESVSPRIAVAPHTFELDVKRGEIIEDKIKVLNQSQVAIPMATRITDFTAEEETGQMLFDEVSQDPSFASRFWFKIENPNFILDPGETEQVKFQIEVPENAEPGGKYAVVLFEPQLPSYYFKEGQPRAIPVIGVLFLFSVEVEGLTRPEEPLTIVEFNIPEKFHLKRLENLMANISGLFTEVRAAEKEIFSIVETSHLPFTLRIKNNNIYHTKPEGKLLILAANGRIVGETEIPKTTILPGKIRRFPVEFKPDLPEKLERYLPVSISDFISKNLLFGKYKAHLLLTTEFAIIEKDIEFYAFPWKITLVVLFILVIFILARRRIGGAAKALVSPKLKIKS